jgi:hypothetical protein
LWNVVVENEEEDIWWKMKCCIVKKEKNILGTIKQGMPTVLSYLVYELLSKTRYWRKDRGKYRGDRKARKNT